MRRAIALARIVGLLAVLAGTGMAPPDIVAERSAVVDRCLPPGIVTGTPPVTASVGLTPTHTPHIRPTEPRYASPIAGTVVTTATSTRTTTATSTPTATATSTPSITPTSTPTSTPDFIPVMNPATGTDLAGAPRQLAYTDERPEDCPTTPAPDPERRATTLPSLDRDTTQAAADQTISTLPSTGQADARAVSRGTGAQIVLGGAALMLLATMGVMAMRKRRP